ncbi:MAG: PCYCGC motif-containing (lipo)protein [Terracidiphilus sp.]
MMLWVKRIGRINRRHVLAVGAFVLTAASYAQWSNPADDVPAYHPAAPLTVSTLPPILAGAKLTGAQFQYPWQKHVYEQVAKVGSVIYQLPCNCRCDRALGHTSLRSCFENLHGTECSTCAKEGFYAYQQTKLGKTPVQIRAAIARHEYEAIDLEKQ